MGGRGFESRQKRPKLKDENICILGDASFSHKKFIPDQKGARSSASISRVCPGRVGADPGTHPASITQHLLPKVITRTLRCGKPDFSTRHTQWEELAFSLSGK